MEQQHTTVTATATATATAKTTILDIPIDCWNPILSKLQTPHHTNYLYSHHHTHIYNLSLTCKHLLSITNTHPCSLTLRPFLPHHLTSLLPPLLRRFAASLQTLSIRYSSSSTVDAALFYVVSSNATARLRVLHFHSLDELPLDGLCHLGSNPNNVRVLSLNRIGDLCEQLVAVCQVFPLVEEVDVSFNNLNDESILGIAQQLKYLRKIDLTENVSITDKSMIALSDCCLDLTDVKVRGYSVTEYGIGYVMRRSTKLSWFSIMGFGQFALEKSDSLFNIENSIGFCRNMSKLEFHNMKVKDTMLCSIAKANLPLTQFKMSYCINFDWGSSMRGFLTLISAYPKIEKLDISHETYLTEEVMKGMVCYLGNLVVIDISYCNGLTTSTFQMLVKNCPALEEMNAMNTQLGKGDLDEPLVKVNNIKCLKLCCNNLLKDELLEKIGIMCPNLDHLGVSFCKNLTYNGITILVKCCRELKQLDIAGWKHSVLFGMDFEGRSLNLELLELESGRLVDYGISEIAKACPKLLYVKLADCREVTATSVKELVEHCTNLRELDLQFCPKVSLETLACIVSNRPSLRTITSRNTNFKAY